MNWSERPVVLLGHGVRASHAEALVPYLMTLGVPVVTSWPAKDLVDNEHPNYMGCSGIYGNRSANRVIHEADTIIAIGNRMAIWNIGYEGPRQDQHVIMVDCDGDEVAKFPNADWVKMSIPVFMAALTSCERPDWLALCKQWRYGHPWLESPAHDDREGYVSAYTFTYNLHKYLRHDEVIVTDMGTPLITAHQVLRLRPPQRLMTSGGLGEMGCALPAAIGASFARGKGQVLCLHADGGMMMNLQELQTIVHHKLPIKIIVYENDGYGMIKETQGKAGMPLVSVNRQTGVSIPDLRMVAHSFGLAACDVRTWPEIDRALTALFASTEPGVVVFHMDPAQPMVPKLDPIYVDGKPTSPAFWDMSPR